jgi:hypothetical protein
VPLQSLLHMGYAVRPLSLIGLHPGKKLLQLLLALLPTHLQEAVVIY